MFGRLSDSRFSMILAAPLWVALASPAAAESVAVRGGAHEGYGRIVFNWKTPVPFSADMAGGKLVVRFNRPIEATYDSAVRALRKYTSGADPGADGRSVAFAMKGNFGLRSFNMGSAVVVDLLDTAPPPGEAAAESDAEKQSAAARPSAKTQAPAEAPSVQVRSGAHKGYTRIVFDWPRKVGYRVEKEGSAVAVNFERSARLNIGRLKSNPPNFVRQAAARLQGGGTVFAMTVPETSRVRHFRSGPKVVLDVMAPSDTEIASAPSSPTPAKEPKKAVTKLATKPVAKPAPEPAVKSVSRDQAKAGDKPRVKPESKPETKPEAKPEPLGKPKEMAAKPMSLKPSRPTPLTTSGGAEMKVAAASRKESGAAPAVKSPQGAPTPSGAAVTAKAIEGAVDAVSLRFDWDEPVAAAVFRRAGSLWAVFDKASSPDLAALRASVGNVIRKIEQVEAPRATALRMDTVASINPSIRRDGLAWVLELRKQPLKPPTPIKANAQPNSPVGARVFLSVPEPGEALAVRDPEVGDNLVVVPVIPLGHGVDRRREYPQFMILTSAQGIVFKPRIDDLRVRPLRQGVEITSVSSLQLSSVTPQEEAGAQVGMMRALTRVFDLKKWRQGGIGSFTRDKQELLLAIAKSKESRREKARLSLARFYFALGFGAESLAVLRLIEENNPEIQGDPEFRALRGANRFLMGHLENARSDLFHVSLDGNDEANFWRAALSASEGDLIKAARGLGRAKGIIRPYPRALKMAMGKLVAEAAILVGDINTASENLKALVAENPTPVERAEIAYIEGRLKELGGDFEGAVAKWESAQEGPHRPSRAKAAVARAELLLKLREMSRAEAIEEYEKLRFAWRGDDFEFQMLRRLGELYLAEGDYRSGLRTLRQAATHFRDHKNAAQVTQQMADAFADVYFGEGGEDLPPMTAIALYDEFKELTPAGQKGDEMIRKIADRLVSVDLLERAAKLLEAQVKFRLKGVEKTRVGTQLALVYLLDRDFEKASKTLEDTRVSGIPKELADQRRHMMARILAEQKKKSAALELLKEDKSEAADVLRLEMFWEARDWPNSAQVLRRLISEFGAEPGKPVNDTQARHILNYAIALTLSNNERGLGKLREDFGIAMENGPFRDAFRLIASPQSQGLVDFRTIAGKVADVENFRGFMAAYRDRLKTENLSDLTSPKS
ncbi:MAG: tetratricopeptide repeat protein [Rhodospirillales bacterium]|jgi:hypothetical protein|nr:tetratricopeptide repeat protein [Rhodospirillales bacterium]